MINFKEYNTKKTAGAIEKIEKINNPDGVTYAVYVKSWDLEQAKLGAISLLASEVVSVKQTEIDNRKQELQNELNYITTFEKNIIGL